MDLTEEIKQLLQTGWQSWSWNQKDIFSIPRFNYPPRIITGPTTITIPTIKLKKPAKGWCSWNAYGSNINEQRITSNMEWLAARQLPGLEYILIDDGWTHFWGDWLKPALDKFPKGLKNMSRNIKQNGYKPGIWLAPFLADPRSNLLISKPSLMVKKGKKYINGFKLTSIDNLLGIHKYILDINKSKAQKYIQNVLDYLLGECKFELIKLDFLYAIYFHPGLKIAEADLYLKEFLGRIRKKYPKVYTIGCGSPLLPALGMVDSLRIGPDVSIPQIRQIPFLYRSLNRYLFSKVLGNIQRRKLLRKFWNLDPDVFTCAQELGISDENILHFQKEIRSLNGNLFLGDNLPNLTKDRVKKFIRPLFPRMAY